MNTRRRIAERKNPNGKNTKSTYFLLPLYEDHRAYYTDYLINVFIDNIDTDNPKVVFIFDNVDDDVLVGHIYKLCNHYCFHESFTDDDEKEIVIIMNVPKEYLNDFKLYIDGKYSKFSEPYKQLLIKLHGKGSIMTHNINLKTGEKTGEYNPIGYKASIFDAIYPTDDKRAAVERRLGCKLPKDAEVLDKINLEEEQYKTIKQLEGEYGEVEK